MGRGFATCGDRLSGKSSVMRRSWLVIAGVVVLAVLAWLLCFAQKPTGPAALGKKWHEQVYSLDEDEVLRLIPPPYSPQRAVDFGRGRGPPTALGEMVYQLQQGGTRVTQRSYGGGYLVNAVQWVMFLSRPRVEYVKDLMLVPYAGDWIVRTDAPLERRAEALQSILRQAMGRQISIERRMEDREVIVASGKWELRQDPELARLIKERALGEFPFATTHLYTTALSPTPGVRWDDVKTGDLPEFLRVLEQGTMWRFEDEVTEPRPRFVTWRRDPELRRTPTGQWNPAELLANVERQTSLKFNKTRRTVPVWFVLEESAPTRPGGGR
jgi:drug/metabolite transporter superfamily protein YnfA